MITEKKIISFLVILVIVAGVLVQVTSKKPETLQNLTTPNGMIQVGIADSVQERTLGLSGRPNLADNEGLLFLFDEPGIYPFWMKDMNFAIDMIWMKKISETNFEVVFIAENVLPETYPNAITPPTEADAVLEVGAMRAGELGIEAGMIVSLE